MALEGGHGDSVGGDPAAAGLEDSGRGPGLRHVGGLRKPEKAKKWTFP